MKDKNKKKPKKTGPKLGDEFSRSDPLGSYTGRPADPVEIPVQDADDL